MTSLKEIADRKKRATWLFFVVAILVILHLVSLFAQKWSWQMERMFNLDGENNIPTWFSSIILALSAFTAYDCFKQSINSQHRNIWRLVAVGLLFLSCDEVAMLHENLGSVLERHVWVPVLGTKILTVFPETVWPIMLAPLVLASILLFGFGLRACLKGSTQAFQLLSLGIAFMFFAGVGLDFSTNFINQNQFPWLLQVEIILEESFEMMGEILILLGLITHQGNY
ncbi:MAG: hypothetical protein HY582_00045 [Candidatus Omnitrophica bacterium]|nr:hypothetical protein [Candidatus Omnitrophota bacterium]